MAWESSRVVARESSSVVAWESSRVMAKGSSSVEAWESSSVEAWESSRVVARGSSRVHNYSPHSNVLLWSYAAAWLFNKAKAVKKSETATVITPIIEKGIDAWLEREGIEKAANILLFKKVSKDFKTQENTENETHWKIGETLTHPKWEPTQRECGPGKFHACAKPYLCDQFRSEPGDRYVAIKVAKKDLFVWDYEPEYPHKIAFRKGAVMHECNNFGDKIESK